MPTLKIYVHFIGVSAKSYSTIDDFALDLHYLCTKIQNTDEKNTFILILPLLMPMGIKGAGNPET